MTNVLKSLSRAIKTKIVAYYTHRPKQIKIREEKRRKAELNKINKLSTGRLYVFNFKILNLILCELFSILAKMDNQQEK